MYIRIVFSFLFLSLPLGAQSQNSEELYVAMGSMQYIDLDHPLWKSTWSIQYKELSKAYFDIMFASFKEVKSRFAKTELKGREIFFNGRALRPHEKNRLAINTFHEDTESMGTMHLIQVACKNRAVVLLYGSAPSPPHFHAFIDGASNYLLVTIHAYYPASNVIGFEYVEVTREMFMDWTGMRGELQSAIKDAMEQCVTNTDGIAYFSDCDNSLQPHTVSNTPQKPGVQSGRVIQFPANKDVSGW